MSRPIIFGIRNGRTLQGVFYSLEGNGLIATDKIRLNKKYVLWNTCICPIASKVGHMTLATPPLGSYIVPYVVLAMAYPTKKKRRV